MVVVPFPICGHEQEHLVAGADPDEIIKVISETHASLPFVRAGRITKHGRFYRERDSYLEVATHEACSPDELISRVAEAEHCLCQATKALSDRSGRDIRLFKHGIDYGRGFRYGVHLNHAWTQRRATDRKSSLLAKFGDALPAFLVATLPVFGGGGLDLSNDGLSFVISPRACATTREQGSSTNGAHALIDLFDRDSPRSDIRRIQILTGDGLRCRRQQRLRVGIQMLFLRLCDLEIRFPLALADPLRGWHEANASGFESLVRLRNGSYLTAYELANRCVEHVSAQLHLLPSWAPAVVQEWVLANEAARGCDIAFPLDWQIVQQLLQGFLQSQGLQREQMSLYDSALSKASAALRVQGQMTCHRIRPSFLRRICPRQISTLKAAIGNSLTLEEFEHLVNVREQCFYLLSQFGELFPGRFFADVNVALNGVLTDLTPIAGATEQPLSRAAVRQRVIRQQSGAVGWAVGWDRIRAPHGTAYLEPESDRLQWSRTSSQALRDATSGTSADEQHSVQRDRRE